MATPTRETNPTFEEAEDAIVVALKADSTIANYAMHVSAFQGTWEMARDELVRRVPAVLVLWAGGPLDPRGVMDFALDAEWHVLVAARNLRGELSRRVPEAAGEVGAYQMVRDVLRALSLQDFDLDGMSPLVPSEVNLVEAVGDDRGMAVYQIIFRCTLDLMVTAPAQSLDEVKATYNAANVDEDSGDTSWVEAIDSTIDLNGES